MEATGQDGGGPDPALYVSRAGLKLHHALGEFEIDLTGWVCADLGSSTGGFVDCLLRHGASRVYAVERGYGVLAASLRGDSRVVVMERTDAMSAIAPALVDLVTIDAGWTRQRRILVAARRWVKPAGRAITLVKPHYETDPAMLRHGVLPAARHEEVLEPIRATLVGLGWELQREVASAVLGRGGNQEYLWLLRPVGASNATP